MSSSFFLSYSFLYLFPMVPEQTLLQPSPLPLVPSTQDASVLSPSQRKDTPNSSWEGMEGSLEKECLWEFEVR